MMTPKTTMTLYPCPDYYHQTYALDDAALQRRKGGHPKEKTDQNKIARIKANKDVVDSAAQKF